MGSRYHHRLYTNDPEQRLRQENRTGHRRNVRPESVGEFNRRLYTSTKGIPHSHWLERARRLVRKLGTTFEAAVAKIRKLPVFTARKPLSAGTTSRLFRSSPIRKIFQQPLTINSARIGMACCSWERIPNSMLGST